MAKEIGFVLKIDGIETTIAQLGAVERQIARQDQMVTNLTKKLKEMEAANKSGTAEFEKLSTRLSNAAIEAGQLKETQQSLSQAILDFQGAAKATEGSIAAYEAKIAETAAKMNNLNVSTAKGKEEYKLLQKELETSAKGISTLKNELTKTDEELKKQKFDEGFKNLKESIEKVSGVYAAFKQGLTAAGITTFNSAIRETENAVAAAKTGIDTYTKATEVSNKVMEAGQAIKSVLTGKTNLLTLAQHGLNTAFKANPIGLVVSLVVALVTAFASLYEGSARVRAGVDGLKQVFVEAFKVFMETIGKIVGGFLKIVDGDFKVGLKELGKGLLQLTPVGFAQEAGGRLATAYNKGYNEKLGDEIKNGTIAAVKKAEEANPLAEAIGKRLGGLFIKDLKNELATFSTADEFLKKLGDIEVLMAKATEAFGANSVAVRFLKQAWDITSKGLDDTQSIDGRTQRVNKLQQEVNKAVVGSTEFYQKTAELKVAQNELADAQNTLNTAMGNGNGGLNDAKGAYQLLEEEITRLTTKVFNLNAAQQDSTETFAELMALEEKKRAIDDDYKRQQFEYENPEMKEEKGKGKKIVLATVELDKVSAKESFIELQDMAAEVNIPESMGLGAEGMRKTAEFFKHASGYIEGIKKSFTDNAAMDMAKAFGIDVDGRENLQSGLDFVSSAFESISGLFDTFSKKQEEKKGEDGGGTDVVENLGMGEKGMKAFMVSAEVMQAGLTLLSQIFSNNAQQRIKEIDEAQARDIEAINKMALTEEQKEAKIKATKDKYEKQKDAEQKKAGAKQKAIAIVQAIIGGAVAVVQAFAQLGPIGGGVMAGVIAAMTAAQIAIIAKQKFAFGGVIPFRQGGMIQGPAHSMGGVPFMSGGGLMEAEGGEVIVNRNIWKRPDFVRSISDMNAATGGKRFFAAGGVIPSPVVPGIAVNTSAAAGLNTAELVAGMRGVIAQEVGSLRVVNNVVDTSSQQTRLINQQVNNSF